MTVDELRVDPAEGGFALWWLGQSGFAIRFGGQIAVVDPYLSDSLTKKYAGTARPHVRLAAPIAEPTTLADGPVTVLAATHQHTDHMDPETLAPIVARSRERELTVSFVVPEAWRTLAADRSGLRTADIIGVDAGSAAEVGHFTFIGIPAAHEHIDRDADAHCLYLGYVIRFGTWTLYHSGDTLRYDGQAEVLKAFDVDVAFLPINGKVGNMTGADAARLAKDMNARVAVPCHYHMFEFNTADPTDEF